MDVYELMLAKIGYTEDEFYKLMESLNELAVLMKDKVEGGGNCGYAIERYMGVIKVSDSGKNCSYAKKAMELFIADGLFEKLLRQLEKVGKCKKNSQLSLGK